MFLTETKSCAGCKASFSTGDENSIHPYIGALPECWKMYGNILVKEYENKDYFNVHRITVDAYASQHIGNQEDRRARQSAQVLPIALYLTFEKEENPKKIIEFLKVSTKIKRDWPSLSQIKTPKWITVKDILPAQTAQEHTELVKKWGKSVWDEYSSIHSEIRDLHRHVSLHSS
ncbi:MAG: hypothetical protein JSS34_03580 [Proteobacteria bacterium]|nr:hypothetical protein [Pseudomonadota bacterium]